MPAKKTVASKKVKKTPKNPKKPAHKKAAKSLSKVRKNLAMVLEQAIELKAQLLITAIRGKSLSNMTPFLDKFRQLIL